MTRGDGCARGERASRPLGLQHEAAPAGGVWAMAAGRAWASVVLEGAEQTSSPARRREVFAQGPAGSMVVQVLDYRGLGIRFESWTQRLETLGVCVCTCVCPKS